MDISPSTSFYCFNHLAMLSCLIIFESSRNLYPKKLSTHNSDSDISSGKPHLRTQSVVLVVISVVDGP